MADNLRMVYRDDLTLLNGESILDNLYYNIFHDHYPWFPTIHHIYIYYNNFMTIIIIFTQEYRDYLYDNTVNEVW